jgi:hypothetical protein
MTGLFVIPAREQPTAVILRRGPSAWYHVIQWETRSDRFVHGAWVRGRIYEEKCDVSPDGRLFLYFIHQGSRWETPFTHAWAAISRVPWLKALAAWPQGETYGGGGRFIDNRTLALRGVASPALGGLAPRGIRIVEADTPLHRPTEEVPEADWCGRDHDGRIIFSGGGQLFRRVEDEDVLIADFTGLAPDPQPAPQWAGRPLP